MYEAFAAFILVSSANTDSAKHLIVSAVFCDYDVNHTILNCAYSCIVLPYLVQSIWLTHTFNGPLSGTAQVSWYQKGKTNQDFTEARDSEWQWHQLGNMQVCTSLQTDNHASTPPLSFLQADALLAVQATASKH